MDSTWIVKNSIGEIYLDAIEDDLSSGINRSIERKSKEINGDLSSIRNND